MIPPCQAGHPGRVKSNCTVVQNDITLQAASFEPHLLPKTCVSCTQTFTSTPLRLSTSSMLCMRAGSPQTRNLSCRASASTISSHMPCIHPHQKQPYATRPSPHVLYNMLPHAMHQPLRCSTLIPCTALASHQAAVPHQSSVPL
jgi:hypothetical protein